MTGWKSYVATAMITGIVAGGAAWTAQSWRYEAKIARIESAQAQSRADAASAALEQLLQDIDTIAAAGRRAAAVGPTLTAQINKLTGALKNATPLPADCRPDDIRVRSLTDAVRAANRAAAGQPLGGALPTDP